MRHKWLSLLFLCFLFPQHASAQGGCFGMIPNYSGYGALSSDANNNFFQTVVVDGITTGNTQCGAIHTPQIYNMLGSVGGWFYGAGQPPSNYISMANSQTIIGVPGTEYTSSYVGEINCSLAGIFFSTGWISDYIEYAYTQSSFINVKDNCVTSNRTGITYCDYRVAPSCTPNTSPPDLNPTSVGGSDLFPDPLFYDIKGWGVRFSTSHPFVFLNVDTYATEVYTSRLPAFCTKNNP